MKTFDFLAVTDAVRLRAEFVSKRKGYSCRLVVRYSSRSVDSYLYHILCINDKDLSASVWVFNASSHLIYDERKFNSLSEAFVYVSKLVG